jgi:two-component sensor histidine kinase
MRDLFEKLRLADDDAGGLLIAVGEAISNAYLHGTPDRKSDVIRLGWTWSGDRMVITVKDSGSGFGNGPRFCPADRRGSLARGVELMRAGVDEVVFFEDHGAKVVLIKRINNTPSA